MPYTREEHAAYMRQWRRTHPLSAVQRMKDSARSQAGVYLRRGKIERQPCWCGARAEMHHPDYQKPREVVWLCRTHHMAEHRSVEEKAA